MKPRSPENTAEVAVIGVDFGEDTFHLVGFDHAGKRVLRKMIKRLALKPIFEELPRCVVGMEPCMSAFCQSNAARARPRSASVQHWWTDNPWSDQQARQRVSKGAFVQAANVMMMRPHRWDALGLGHWPRGVTARMPHNKAAVALANKLARTA